LLETTATGLLETTATGLLETTTTGLLETTAASLVKISAAVAQVNTAFLSSSRGSKRRVEYRRGKSVSKRSDGNIVDNFVLLRCVGWFMSIAPAVIRQERPAVVQGAPAAPRCSTGERDRITSFVDFDTARRRGFGL